jgi:hypothetical protein
MKTKLANILFTVALNTKLSNEAGAAIHAVAYLIKDTAIEDLSAALTNKLSNTILASTNNLNSAIIMAYCLPASTQPFLLSQE